MAGGLQSCCGASTAGTKGDACSPVSQQATAAIVLLLLRVVQRQTAWCCLELLLQHWVSNPEPQLADRFIFHCVTPADVTNALHHCLQSLPSQSPARPVSVPSNTCRLCNNFTRTGAGWWRACFSKP